MPRTTTQAGGWWVVLLAVGVPWLTWWTLTTPNPNQAVTDTPIMLAGLGLLMVLCLRMAQDEPWLAALAGYVLLRSLPLSSPYTFEASYLTVLAAFALYTMRTLDPVTITRLKGILLAGGACQACYGALQAVGYDPLWIGWGQQVSPELAIRGTLGNRDFFGAYNAILLCISPVWLMPVFLVGLGLSKAVVAMLAACVGLIVRYRAHRWVVVGGSLGLLACAGFALWRSPDLGSLWHRVDVWRLALQDVAFHPILGWGTGHWALRIPILQVQTHTWDSGVFVAAHNDYLQLLYEGGVVAVGILGVWVWQHRRIYAGSMGGAVAVLAVNACGNFPFHVGTTALLALVVLGLACAEERSVYAADNTMGPRSAVAPDARIHELCRGGIGLEPDHPPLRGARDRKRREFAGVGAGRLVD